MSKHFPPPPDCEPDTAWPALLQFATEVAMTLRRTLSRERAEHAAIVAEKDRRIEIYRRIIRTFEINNQMQKGPR